MTQQEAQQSGDGPPAHGLAWGHWTEEVRLAMAWNGGVSLAVWMGGVAVELDRARRARRPPATVEEALEPAPDPEILAPGTSGLYYALCCAFDRALVVDILTGASAGGLNGALLGSAIAHARVLDADFLRERWLSIGDFGTLLQPIDAKQPASVMQGKLFYSKLVDAFAGLLGTPDGDAKDIERTTPQEPLEPATVLLDVQATNVQGEERSFLDDWDESFYAREYRAPLKFRKRSHFDVETLAAAARASASFPAAFEPQELAGDAAARAGFPNNVRWAIDGGLLENAPIRPAIELIVRRPAMTVVKRFVCYVNAAPSEHQKADPTPDEPTLKEVLSYVVNLPRDGRTIDQLNALEDSKRRAGLTGDVGLQLLRANQKAVEVVAHALFETYQRRRALLSLEEILSDPEQASGPAPAARVLGELPGPGSLPWIPGDLAPPAEPEAWRWGVRPAQRVLQLELDLLRFALLRSNDQADIEKIFRGRGPIDHAIEIMDDIRDDFVRPEGSIAKTAQRLRHRTTREAALQDLEALAAGTALSVSSLLWDATEAFHKTLRGLSGSVRAQLPSSKELFGWRAWTPSLSTRGYAHFLERTLAIEVIRRTFSDDLDIESAQALHVAQLTPRTRAPLFTRQPLAKPGPHSSEEKLTGIRLGHFAGFYRSSWRANDFMWGRLDAAARIAQLLVDPGRAKALEAQGRHPSTSLARALVPAQNEDPRDWDRRRLVWEALSPTPAGDESKDIPNTDALRDQLDKAIQADLTSGGGKLTQVVCARALQYEVLAEEAPHLVKQTLADKAMGAHSVSLDWRTEPPATLWPVIDELREATGANSLPCRLGRDDKDEQTSALAFRMIAQAMLVTLAALAGVFPLAHLLGPARVPLFAVEGVAARRPLDRLAVVLAFAGAAGYVAARFLTIPASPGEDIPLRAVWSPQVLALWVAFFAVVGMLMVPSFRALRSKHWRRRAVQAFFAAALLATGGGVALGWHLKTNGPIEALTAWHATYSPPSELLWIVVAAGGFHVASRYGLITRLGAVLLHPVGRWVSVTAITLGAIGAVLAWFAYRYGVVPRLLDGGWNAVFAWLAVVGPLVLAAYLHLWRRTPQGAILPPSRPPANPAP